MLFAGVSVVSVGNNSYNFFCNKNTLFTIGEVPQKIKPYDIME